MADLDMIPLARADDKDTTDIWDDYQRGIAYQASSGLSKNIPQFVNFYEGRQWAAATPKTKNMPRPVVNIVKMICRNKRSAILSTPVRIVYKADKQDAGVDKFNRFADFIQKEIEQEKHDKKGIDDGVKKGSYFYHYYWDAEAIGMQGNREGGLRCEMIDPLNIFFADPTETDEQKQKWILIASREEVDSVRAKCDKDVDPDMIVSDTSDSKYGTLEQEGSNLVTVLTRYFRKDGEVWCEKGTRSVTVNKPFPLSPDVEAAGKELGIEDAPNNSLPDDAKRDEEPLIERGARATLYPIVVGNYESREKCIYGLGEVEGLIPNQKSINFNLAMSLLNVQEIAWGKYIALPGALGNQVITNDPGQVLTDYSKTGTGIRKMTEQPIQTAPLQLVETLTNMTRTVTGSTEIMTGEIIGANMSGAAIAQLQSTAQQPIEDLKDTFWLVKEKQGKVLAQFFKLYYAESEFTYETETPRFDGMGQPIVGADGMPVKEMTLATDVFNSSEYADMDFTVVVEATSGTRSSTAGDINMLDTLFAKGAIDIKTYVNAYPDNAISNREELLRGIEESENSQVNQMRTQVEQLTQALQQCRSQLEQSAKTIQAQQATVDRVTVLIKENQDLKSYIANLYTEARVKIAASNEQIKLGNQKIEETTRDATDFAQTLYSMLQGGQREKAAQMAYAGQGTPKETK